MLWDDPKNWICLGQERVLLWQEANELEVLLWREADEGLINSQTMDWTWAPSDAEHAQDQHK